MHTTDTLSRVALMDTPDTFENDVEAQVTAVLKYVPIIDRKMEEIRVVILSELYDAKPYKKHHPRIVKQRQTRSYPPGSWDRDL